MDQLRFSLNRLRGRETVIEVTPLGLTTLRLAIAGRRGLRRAREVHLEAGLLHRMIGAVRPGDRLYDIGANIGMVSLLLGARPQGAELRIHAFEPEPRNFRQLERNVVLNGLESRLATHRIALGMVEGEVELFVRGGSGEGRHSIAAKKGSTGSIRVPVTTASTFARVNDAWPDVMKIDVEGAEGQVLAGMEAMIAERRPREIFLEIHPKGDGDRMPSGGAGDPPLIDDWLRSRGFRPVWRERRGSGEHRHYR